VIPKTIFCLTVLAATTSAQMPTDSEIRKILVERVDEFHQSVGIVAGMIGPSGRKLVSYGALEKGDSRVLDGDTVFEIGSVTKVFTSLLLADMVERGEVALGDPVSKYLPAGVKVPQRNGRQIWAAAPARQFETNGPGQPLRRLHRRTAIRIPFFVRTAA